MNTFIVVGCGGSALAALTAKLAQFDIEAEDRRLSWWTLAVLVAAVTGVATELIGAPLLASVGIALAAGIWTAGIAAPVWLKRLA